MQTAIHLQLDILQDRHLTAVLAIADARFGQGFLSRSALLPYLQSETHICQVALYEGQVVGFSLMEMGSPQAIAPRLKGESAWFLQYFNAYSRLAYRSLTAVAQAFEGRGIAHFLVSQGLAFLSDKVEAVICDAWKSSYTHIGKVLERNGYRVLREVPLYWAAESVEQQYQCAVCGQPPCECTAVFYARFFQFKPLHDWWQRPDLHYHEGQLHFAQTPVLDFIKTKKTPLYIYNIQRILDNYGRMEQALAQHTNDFSIYYAVKANRHPAILSHLLARTSAGLDLCSPNELDWAFRLGFSESQLTYTGSSIADRELRILAQHPRLQINLDSLSAVRRFAAMVASRDIGIRINPEVGMAYHQGLEYTGSQVTKFGIYREQWAALRQLVQGSPLRIRTLHCHAGSGFLSDQLPRLDRLFEQMDAFLDLFPSVETLNLGGGLGVPQQEGDQPLDLAAWAAVVCGYAKRKGLRLAFEPGDFLVKDAGILITEVNTVEVKKGKHFVGLDVGMNVNYEYAYYQMNLEAVPLRQPETAERVPITLAGNINEPIDLFSEEKYMPPLQEGDFVALINSGGYGASTSSNHCMRGDFGEYVLLGK